jgi:hypothetical protein
MAFGRFPAFEESKSSIRPLMSVAARSVAAASMLQLSANWLSSGALSTPRDQGDTGMCSSFAIVTAVEALNFLKTHTRITLAPAYIHSCLLDLQTDQGANLIDALQVAAAHGISYGFPGDTTFPRDHCSTGNTFAFRQIVQINSQDDAINVLANQGPLVATMMIEPGFMRVGRDVIYQYRDSEDRSIHSVCVVDNVKQHVRFTDDHLGRSVGMIVAASGDHGCRSARIVGG